MNYAQARDQDAMRGVFNLLDARGFLKRNQALGTVQPGLYEVVFTLRK